MSKVKFLQTGKDGIGKPKTVIAKSITLNVHPFIDAFLKKGVKNIQRQWFLKFKKWIVIRPMTELGILEYQFLDESDNSI